MRSESLKTSAITPYSDIHASGGDTAKPLSLSARLRLMTRWLPGGERILDGGCGSGEYVRALRTEGFDACGVEFLEDKVARAARDPDLRDYVHHGDLEQLPFPDNFFAGAILNEVLEHVPDDRAALREVCRVLRPEGRLVIFSPNRRYPFESHGVNLLRSRRPVPRWTPLIPWIPMPLARRLFHFWARNYGQGELKALVEDAGFSVLHRDFVWQTFEGIGGRQPPVIRALRPLLRAISRTCERIPFIRTFGISQVLVCKKASVQGLRQ